VTAPGIEKAEALRQAQLALLHGEAGPRQPPASPYANPFYWAPFVLIGNWK
jgi:CHAT domain-containing protein